MERKIELKMVNPDHYWMKGIYLIRIGRMKYVGKSNCIGERIRTHQYEINKVMKDFGAIVNGVSSKEYYGSYRKIARYLLENPLVISGTVEVLERQVCSNMLTISENFYLTEFANDKDFFNAAQKGSKSGVDKNNRWDVKEIDNRVVCFDPRFPQLQVSNINSGNRNRAILKEVNDEKNKPDYRKKAILQEKDRLLKEYPNLKAVILRETLNRLVEIK